MIIHLFESIVHTGTHVSKGDKSSCLGQEDHRVSERRRKLEMHWNVGMG